MKYYVILGSNSLHQIQLWGEGDGQPFVNKTRAKQAMKLLQKKHVSLDFMVMKIDRFPSWAFGTVYGEQQL